MQALSLPKLNPLRVFIPSTILETESSLMLKTLKLGQIMRICSIFKVLDVSFYNDGNSPKEAALIDDLCQYIKMPPHLRKVRFILNDNLKFAGILPPLSTPSHSSYSLPSGDLQSSPFVEIPSKQATYLRPNNASALSKKHIQNTQPLSATDFASTSYSKSPEITTGFILNTPHEPQDLWVYISPKIVCRFSSISNNRSYSHLQTIPVLLDSKPRLLSAPNSFWEIQHKVSNQNLLTLLEPLRNSQELIIGTSRQGQDIDLRHLQAKMKLHTNLVLVFGAIHDGLPGVLKRARGSKKLDAYFDEYLNLIPDQGTKTIRTEEALLAGLSLFQFLKKI